MFSKVGMDTGVGAQIEIAKKLLPLCKMAAALTQQFVEGDVVN